MIGHWIQLKALNAPVGLGDLLGMRIRGSYSKDLGDALVVVHSAKLDIPVQAVEMHALMGGNPSDLVKAVIRLNRSSQLVPLPLLHEVDLKEGRLAELAELFDEARELSPDLSFVEVARRYLDGEDVFDLAKRSELRPLSNMRGWVVRIEIDAQEFHEVEAIVARLGQQTRVEVRRPGSQQWEPFSRLRGLAGGA